MSLLLIIFIIYGAIVLVSGCLMLWAIKHPYIMDPNAPYYSDEVTVEEFERLNNITK